MDTQEILEQCLALLNQIDSAEFSDNAALLAAFNEAQDSINQLLENLSE